MKFTHPSVNVVFVT